MTSEERINEFIKYAKTLTDQEIMNKMLTIQDYKVLGLLNDIIVERQAKKYSFPV